jgi:hypothetical protein
LKGLELGRGGSLCRTAAGHDAGVVGTELVVAINWSVLAITGYSDPALQPGFEIVGIETKRSRLADMRRLQFLSLRVRKSYRLGHHILLQLRFPPSVPAMSQSRRIGNARQSVLATFFIYMNYFDKN